MKKQEKKSRIPVIMLALLLIISSIAVTLPSVHAQTTEKVTHAFIGAIPNPVGVNQQVLLHVGITDYLAAASDGFEGLWVTIEDPEGVETTLENIRTDSTGGTGAVFVPTKAGTYTVTTHFPTQDYTWMGPAFFDPSLTGTITYLASESEPLELIVEADPIQYYPGNSLPSEYWSRPIDAQLWEWTSIAANWVWGGGTYGGSSIPNYYAPYNDGPETPHILWTNKLTTGGLVGGALGYQSYECGDAYEGFFASSVIINGVLYYNRFKANYPVQRVVAVDIHTGEQLWEKTLGNNERVAFGQTFYWDSYNYHGTFDYIWTSVSSGFFGPTTWKAYDAYTADHLFSIEGIPSGTQMYGPKGEIYIYSLDTMAGTLTLWNSSRTISDSGSWMGGFGAPGYITYNASEGIEWTVPAPSGLAGSVFTAEFQNKMIGGSISREEVTLWGINLEEGDEGELLFEETWTAPSDWADAALDISYAASSLEDEVLVLRTKETRLYYGFSTENGDYLWVTDDSEHYMNNYVGTNYAIVDGQLISTGYSGIVYAYDVNDGDLMWSYAADDVYSEVLWANNWPLQILFITDGKVYLGHYEHSPIDPKPRGAPFICLDMATGNVVWRIDGAFRQTSWGGMALIGDSIITTMDTYDQQIYGIGKGASELTVSAAPKVSTLGGSVLIEGTVMDVSPGTKETDIAIRFPSGVPAISDADMGDWMKYVYKQFARPADATGVRVDLCAVDPNGNYQDLGSTTTDSYGTFAVAFEPEVPGKYMVIASFAGSEGYYGSTKTTYVQVDPAPAAATPMEPEEPEPEVPVEEPTEPAAPLITTEVAIALAVVSVAIVAAVVFFVLRRRK
jgi:outer membrane protein assembly factor BamB